MPQFLNLHYYIIITTLLFAAPTLFAGEQKSVDIVSKTELLQQAKPATNNWLQDAESDPERFKKLEVYLRGFDQPMLEVGQRYEKLYYAIQDKNWGLANYQWKKIKRTINAGLMKRPKRAPNAKAMFLENVWLKLDKSIQSQQNKSIEEDFMLARQACLHCHIAEKVDFINNQALFTDLIFKQE